MKLLYCISWVFISFFAVDFSNASQSHHVENQNNITTIFFKISSPDNDHVSYIFGTHHAFGKYFFDSLTIAKEKLLASDILIKENLNIPGHMAKDIINRRTNKTNWKKFLSKSDLEFIEILFANSETDFKKMTPTELFAFLNRHFKEKVCKAKKETDNYLTLDDYIGNLTEENELKLISLETSEEQFKLIRKDIQGMPKKIHKKRLASVIKRLRSKSGDCSEIEWYRNMDFDYRFTRPCQNKLILTDRNKKWISAIEKQLNSNNCFIAIGLSHLMFESSLINHIKKLGYQASPIPVN